MFEVVIYQDKEHVVARRNTKLDTYELVEISTGKCIKHATLGQFTYTGKRLTKPCLPVHGESPFEGECEYIPFSSRTEAQSRDHVFEIQRQRRLGIERFLESLKKKRRSEFADLAELVKASGGRLKAPRKRASGATTSGSRKGNAAVLAEMQAMQQQLLLQLQSQKGQSV